MKIVTTLSGATVTGAVTDPVESLKGPFKPVNLGVLYLLDGGTVGDPYPNTLTDASGNGNHATKASGASAPDTVAEGIEAVDAAGSWYELAGWFPENMTILAVGQFVAIPSSVPWLFTFGGVRGPALLGSDGTLQAGLFGGLSPANQFRGVDDSSRADDQWFCQVISINTTTKGLRIVMPWEGGFLTFDGTDANMVDHIDVYRDLSSPLLFGVAAHGAEDVTGSKAALFAGWDTFMTLADMQDQAMRAVAWVYDQRGVVAL